MRRNPMHGGNHVSRGEQHLTNHKFFHAVCICTGRIKDHHAFLRETLQRNVVDPGPRSRNGQGRFSQFLLVHVRGANQYAVRFLLTLRQRKVRKQAL